jgi:anti-anti-sigma factor
MVRARFEEAAGVLVVTPLVRDLDAEVAPELRRAILERARGRRRVVVSLAEVERADCSGLAVLVSALQRMAPGGELSVACASAAVRALLAATHLDALFPLLDDAGAAGTP